MPDILHELTIQAPPEKVYQAVTEQSGLSSWWTTQAEAKPELGSIAHFRFDQGKNHFQFKIAQLEPGRAVRWDHAAGGPPDWQGTHVTWALTPTSTEPVGGTKVLFGHRGYMSTEGSYAFVNYSWAMYLASLKQYLETGKGSPYTG